MDGDLEENADRTQEIELQEVLSREQEKNAELKEYLCQLLKENSDYKKKYNALQQRISGLGNILEKNARLCQELYDDAKSALQMGTFTTINSSTPQSSENRIQNATKTLTKPNPQPGPSGLAQMPNRVNIGPLNLKELEKSLGDLESGLNTALVNGTNNLETNEQLTTILEENTIVTSTEGALAKAKELFVRLSRLPHEIVQEHLHKHETVDSSVNLSVMDPHFTSTPLKLETMKGLGLFPSESRLQNRFVNMRRTYKKEIQNSPPKRKEVGNSPAKQKKLVQNELKNLFIDMKEGHKIEENGNPTNSRPSRRTRPKQLKEPNLKRKTSHHGRRRLRSTTQIQDRLVRTRALRERFTTARNIQMQPGIVQVGALTGRRPTEANPNPQRATGPDLTVEHRRA